MDKRGYPTPVSDWLADRNGDLAREILLGSGAALHKYCDRRAIERLISRHASAPQSTGNNVYKLVSTELWLQSCIQSSAAP
jgi:asparagine synthase (glutamine-hydrolysing)